MFVIEESIGYVLRGFQCIEFVAFNLFKDWAFIRKEGVGGIFKGKRVVLPFLLKPGGSPGWVEN